MFDPLRCAARMPAASRSRTRSRPELSSGVDHVEEEAAAGAA
jgi:hypothetical protein